MPFTAIEFRQQGPAAFIRFASGEKNCITPALIEDMNAALDLAGEKSSVIVLEGSPEYFCYGADFSDIAGQVASGVKTEGNPAPLFDLWKRMTDLPCAVISHVRGAVNAGGMGFVAASDIVVSSEKAAFSLSELLFGLMPAMVLPFLIRRVGFAHANYLTLTTRPVSAAQAKEFGLIDLLADPSEPVVRQLTARLARTPKDGIRRYKAYAAKLCPLDDATREKAIAANKEVFGDETNLRRVANFTLYGKYPWEV